MYKISVSRSHAGGVGHRVTGAWRHITRYCSMPNNDSLFVSVNNTVHNTILIYNLIKYIETITIHNDKQYIQLELKKKKYFL